MKSSNKWRSHIYRARKKYGGWHNRRYGKNTLRGYKKRQERRDKQC